MAKGIERLGIQAEKQQQQLLLKYIKGMIREKSTMTKKTEGSLSKGRPIEGDLGGSKVRSIGTMTGSEIKQKRRRGEIE